MRFTLVFPCLHLCLVLMQLRALSGGVFPCSKFSCFRAKPGRCNLILARSLIREKQLEYALPGAVVLLRIVEANIPEYQDSSLARCCPLKEHMTSHYMSLMMPRACLKPGNQAANADGFHLVCMQMIEQWSRRVSIWDQIMWALKGSHGIFSSLVWLVDVGWCCRWSTRFNLAVALSLCSFSR